MKKLCTVCKQLIDAESLMQCSRCKNRVCGPCGAQMGNLCPKCNNEYRFFC